MKTTPPASYPRFHIRARSPRLSFALWTFAILVWAFSELKAQPSPANLPDLYCIVVDRSGSMGPGLGNNNLVGPARDKLREFINNLEPNTAIRIVFFDSRVGEPRQWIDLSPDTKRAINQWIAAEFRPAGGTRLFDTVGNTLSELLHEREHHGRVGLLVFSDGEDNESKIFKGWPEIERLSADLLARQPATFLRLYSLGNEPRSKPGSPWVVQEAPTANDLRNIILEPAPEARFKIFPENPEVGDSIAFAVLSGPGRIESAEWNFGDKNTAREIATNHSYKTDGIFTGSLSVTGPAGTETKPFTVTVSKRPPLTAAFSWFPDSPRVGDAIEFVDESSGNPTARRWFIDAKLVDGGVRCSWLPQQPGRFRVRLEIVRDTETARVERVIAVGPPRLDASFAITSGHSIVVGTSIVASVSATNVGAVSDWLVGGAVVGTGPELVWTPSDDELIEIVHRVTRGDEVETATDRVQVVTQPPPAEFTVTPGSEVDLGQEVSFTANTTEPGWEHEFTLSTGEIVHGPSASLPMTHLGRVDVLHRVVSPSGHSELRETVVVLDAVTARFFYKAAGNRSPVEVHFTPLSRSGIVAYEWAFGDGNGSQEPAPSHTYTSAGEFRPTLRIRDIAGRSLSYQTSEPITVIPPSPWWLPWSIAGGVLLATAATVSLFVWDRRRHLELDGRLEWQYGAQRGRIELSGLQLDLGALNITGWGPSAAYVLVRRKSAGHQLLRNGAVEQTVDEDISLEVEGVGLRLVP